MNLILIMSIGLGILATLLILAWIKYKIFFNEVVLEKWGPGIASFLGKVVIALLTLWGANYYYHNVYIFNQDKAIEFKAASKDFALLRTNVNKLSALVKMKETGQLKDMTEKEFQKEVQDVVKSIIKYEIKISNITDLPYYFGKSVSKKQHNFIDSTNYTTIKILKKQYYPSDKLTDTLYYSINYSMMMQLYNSHKCSRCKALASMTTSEILKRFEMAGKKYSLIEKKHYLRKLTYKEIICAEQLAKRFN